MAWAKESCGNGNCTKPVYRGRACFRCWAGIKWTSINQRVANKNGNNPSYVGVPIMLTRPEFIQWILDNPPPDSMETPSIDRIEAELGYAPGNIRWLERDRNSAGANRDVPDGMKLCSRCQTVKPLAAFGKNNSKRWGAKVQDYCRPCKATYVAQWKEKRNGLGA